MVGDLLLRRVAKVTHYPQFVFLRVRDSTLKPGNVRQIVVKLENGGGGP